MRRLYDLIVQNVDRLARVLTEENGKPLAEAKGEVFNGAEYLNWYAEETRRVYGETFPARPGGPASGCCASRSASSAAITPWNFPSSMSPARSRRRWRPAARWSLKPAEQTPLSALAVRGARPEAGLPAGRGQPRHHPRPGDRGAGVPGRTALVRKISFTGSTEVGKYLMRGRGGRR